MQARSYRIAVIGGDGIGPEVTSIAVALSRVVAGRLGLDIHFDELPWSSRHFIRYGRAMPPGEIERIGATYDAILLGAVGDPALPNNEAAREIVLGLRFELDLYVNVRPVRLLHDRITPLAGKTRRDIQFTIIRENTEGIYGGIGGQQYHDSPWEVATAVMVATHHGVERILRAAFDFACRRGHDRVCLIHKSNAIPQVFDLWLRLFRKIGSEYPDLEQRDLLVDRAALEFVRAPEQFRTVVTSNLFGDILTDLGAAIAGGLGTAASANLHPGKIGLFEPVHGSAPDIAGKGMANPIAACLSAALMFEHLRVPRATSLIERAVERAVARGLTTPDLGGALRTEEVGRELIAIAESLPLDHQREGVAQGDCRRAAPLD